MGGLGKQRAPPVCSTSTMKSQTHAALVRRLAMEATLMDILCKQSFEAIPISISWFCYRIGWRFKHCLTVTQGENLGNGPDTDDLRSHASIREGRSIFLFVSLVMKALLTVAVGLPGGIRGVNEQERSESRRRVRATRPSSLSLLLLSLVASRTAACSPAATH